MFLKESLLSYAQQSKEQRIGNWWSQKGCEETISVLDNNTVKQINNGEA